MVKLPLDQHFMTKVREVKQRVEVCDEEGRIVGYFEPSIYAGMVIPPDPSPEELARREAGPFYTTAEVIAHLQSLGKS